VAVVDDGADDGAVAFEGDDRWVRGFADFLPERWGDGSVGGDLDGAAGNRAERVAAADFAGQFGQLRGAAAGADDEHSDLVGGEHLIERLIPWDDDGSGHGR